MFGWTDYRIPAATVFGSIVRLVRDREQRARSGKPTRETESVGDILVNFLTELPLETAAKIMNSATRSDISATVKDGKVGELRDPRLRSIAGIDLVRYAVKAIVLRDPAKRLKLFEKMAELSPGHNGDAAKFLLLLKQKWNQYRSEYSGPTHLRHQFGHEEGDKRSAQIIRELIDDVTPVVRKYGQWPERFGK